MMKFKNLFKRSCSVIGMVHVDALPGTPLYRGSVDKIVSKACKETEMYLRNDIDALMVENMHDVPYIKSNNFNPETTSTMCRICTELRKIIPNDKPFGIQILAGGNKEALAVANACNMNFIRAEGFVFGHVADEGYIESDAGLILRYRKSIGAEDILIFTDIKKKHSSHAITNDVSLTETAKAAEFFLSDGIILTGMSTGHPANPKELEDLKSSMNLPVLIGSGITLENLEKYIKANALIVGSYFKKDGKWNNDLEEVRIKMLLEKFNTIVN